MSKNIFFTLVNDPVEPFIPGSLSNVRVFVRNLKKSVPVGYCWSIGDGYYILLVAIK